MIFELSFIWIFPAVAYAVGHVEGCLGRCRYIPAMALMGSIRHSYLSSKAFSEAAFSLLADHQDSSRCACERNLMTNNAINSLGNLKKNLLEIEALINPANQDYEKLMYISDSETNGRIRLASAATGQSLDCDQDLINSYFQKLNSLTNDISLVIRRYGSRNVLHGEECQLIFDDFIQLQIEIVDSVDQLGGALLQCSKIDSSSGPAEDD